MNGQSLGEAIAARSPEAVIASLTRDSAAILRRGDVDELREAASAVAPDGGPLPASVAWRVGYVLHQSGQFDEAVAVLSRGRTDDDPVEVARLTACTAASLWARGEAAPSREHADRALERAQACGDDTALSLAWVAQAFVAALEGDRHRNRTCYERALTTAERADDLLTRIRVLNNLGSLEIEEGNCGAALVHLDEATALSDPELAAGVRALSSINRAEALLGLGRVDESAAELQHAVRLTRTSESPFLGFALLGMGDANRVRGNATLAASSYREAIEIGERTENAQILVSATAGLARCLAVDDPDEARGLVKQALDQPAALGQVEPLLAAGWIALANSQPDDAHRLARLGAQEAGRRHESAGLAEALELQALLTSGPRATDLLDEAASMWTSTGRAVGLATNQVLRACVTGDRASEQEARARLRTLGVRDDVVRIAGPLQAAAQAPGAGVAVRSLGAFALMHDGVPVPASVWQSRKSRDALKILAGRRGRAITRDALAELLWPGDAAAPGNKLSVVLSTLRAVLDPPKSAGSDHYLVADRASVRLDARTVDLDTVVFHRAAVEALRASRAREPTAVVQLERAAARYTGHFLEDDTFSEWAAEVREELLGLAQEVRRELATALIDRHQPGRAVPWLISIVADDPYDEPSYHQLVSALSQARRHGEARRVYRAYCARMAELDLAAEPLDDLLGRRQEVDPQDSQR